VPSESGCVRWSPAPAAAVVCRAERDGICVLHWTVRPRCAPRLSHFDLVFALFSRPRWVSTGARQERGAGICTPHEAARGGGP